MFVLICVAVGFYRSCKKSRTWVLLVEGSCAYASYGGVLLCILKHIFICLTECFPRGAAQVQKLIDAGALVPFQEDNGLEMVAEFQREVGGKTTQKNTLMGERELFFLVWVSVCVSLSICVGPYEHYIESCVFCLFL